MMYVRPSIVASALRCADPLETAMAQHWAEAARILRGVADLFSKPGTWTQHAWARDAGGMQLARAHDSMAVCWCFLGGIRKVRGPGMSPAENEALEAIRRVLFPSGNYDTTIASWNDHPFRRVEEVRRVAIQAAERLEARA